MEKVNQISKRKKGIATQNQILKTASQLFACKGYDNVSVREIAKAVGIKESSVYNHFKGKQDILDVLFREFAVRAPLSRPSYEQLEAMVAIMSLREILKNILFSVGRNTDEILGNTAIIIQCERFRRHEGAQAYYNYIVKEPTAYYQKLIEMMLEKKKISNRNAHKIIKHYCDIATALSQEYFMAANGFGSVEEAVRRMLDAIDFFCDLLEDKDGDL